MSKLHVDLFYPGVISLELGPALDMDRTKGYDMGIFLVVDSEDALRAWASNPAHLRSVRISSARAVEETLTYSRLHAMREEMSEDSLAFNLAY